MIKTTEISAIFIEETGEVKCGYCGKTQLHLTKLQKKLSKSIDKQHYIGIINVKCSRCKAINRLKF